MTINMGLALGLIMSLIMNIFGLWYVRALLGRFNWISENINDLVEIIQVYSNNLEGVRNLEQFYGDQEIKNLSIHTASLLEVLEDYKDVVLITEPIEYEDEPETQQKEQQNAEEEVQEKHVLYAGTRERNN
jgi:hypothetical protein|tara:strand:- start:205 stop:597 length:393 start_codon:yes stop_codon:yes gene_type:complete